MIEITHEEFVKRYLESTVCFSEPAWDVVYKIHKLGCILLDKNRWTEIQALLDTIPRCCLDEKHYCERDAWVGELRKAVGGETPYTEPSEYRTLGY